MVSRLVASTRAQVALLEALLAQRLARRDDQGVELLNKVLSGACKRLSLMLEEHRACTNANRRPSVIVAVGNAATVNVRSEE